MDQYEIAEIFHEIANILYFLDDKPFRSIAYRKAAKIIENTENFIEQVASQQLLLPGIGKEISKMIYSLYQNKKLTYLEELREKVPVTLFDLLEIRKLGKKHVKYLYHEFNIKSVEELEQALISSGIPKFRKATTLMILKSIKKLRKEGKKLFWQEGMKIAFSLGKKLSPNTFEIVGELRRKLELISRVDLLAEEDPNIIESFLTHSFVKEVLHQTKTKICVLLKQGITAEVHFIKKENLPYNIVYHTGSKAHIKELKQQAILLQKKFLPKTFRETKTEEDIYHKLHMQCIPPELREGKGEIEAAKKNSLPTLIEENEIKGVFHCHTTESDGNCSIEEMVQLAQKKNWEYIGISDHSKSSKIANGLSEERLARQIELIKDLNKKTPSFRIFSGIECDILPNGDLDFSDDVLQYLDFVIVSVHSSFHLNHQEMTKRLIKAIENPCSTIVGHISGRLLRRRDPYALDIFKVIDACAHNKKVIELNATPNRLDMDWRYWHYAKEKGVLCSINPDAHALEDFQNISLGVNCARKGWLEKNDVINTLYLADMIKFLKMHHPHIKEL